MKINRFCEFCDETINRFPSGWNNGIRILNADVGKAKNEKLENEKWCTPKLCMMLVMDTEHVQYDNVAKQKFEYFKIKVR